VLLLQEYCDLGTLKAFLVRNDVPARVAAGEEQAVLLLVLMLRDTAKGLAALHNQAVVHGDLVRRVTFVLSCYNWCFSFNSTMVLLARWYQHGAQQAAWQQCIFRHHPTHCCLLL
jgi:hypothetical protein